MPSSFIAICVSLIITHDYRAHGRQEDKSRGMEFDRDGTRVKYCLHNCNSHTIQCFERFIYSHIITYTKYTKYEIQNKYYLDV
jgi:hypothetical protein